MATVRLTPELRAEYQRLFDRCDIRPERSAEVETLMQRVLAARARYAAAEQASGVPWFFIGAVHQMESSGRFDRHLHNGDPLTARTVQVPAGRPKAGQPPFAWEVSAADALALHGLSGSTDWSLPSLLYEIERYNGFGYRLQHPQVLSPYLWSYSTHYRAGKYVADGRWSDTAVSAQCGAATLLRRMVERGHIAFQDQPPPGPQDAPLVVPYAARKPSAADALEAAMRLQRWLNSHAGIFVRVDGWAGRSSSDAYRQITGHYLPGDPLGGTARGTSRGGSRGAAPSPSRSRSAALVEPVTRARGSATNPRSSTRKAPKTTSAKTAPKTPRKRAGKKAKPAP